MVYYWEWTRVTARTDIYDNQVCIRKEYVRVVKRIRALSLTLVAPVRIPVVGQTMLGVAYIQLTISNNCETGIGLAFCLRTSLVLNNNSNTVTWSHALVGPLARCGDMLCTRKRSVRNEWARGSAIRVYIHIRLEQNVKSMTERY